MSSPQSAYRPRRRTRKTKPILVRPYQQRRLTSPEQQVQAAAQTLKKLDSDKDLSSVCYVSTTEERSQVIEPDGGFKQGACSIINIEPLDVEDAVECAATLQHEAFHAKKIKEGGEATITIDNEIEAHKSTITFLKKWKRADRREYIQRRVPEVIAEEKHQITLLKIKQREETHASA